MNMTVWVLVVILFIVSLAPIFVEWKRRELDLFNLRNIFVAYFLLEYGVWTIHMLITGKTRLLQEFPTGPMLVRVMLYAIAGIAVYHLGYRMKFGRLVASILPATPTWNSRRSAHVLLVLTLLTFAGLALLIYKAGGLRFYLTHINEARLTRLHGEIHWRYLVNLSSIGFLVAFIDFNKCRNRRSRVTAVVVFCIAFVGNLLFAHRVVAMFILLYAAIVWHYMFRKITMRVLLISTLAVLVFNMVYVTYRESQAKETKGVRDVGSVLGNTFLGRFHGTESLIAVINGIRGGQSFQYGTYFIRDFALLLVPKTLWPQRPPTSCEVFNRRFVSWYEHGYGGIAGGFAPSLLGELYWIMGFTAVLFGMFFLGFVSRVVYAGICRNVYGTTVLVYAISSAYISQINESLATTSVKFVSMIISAVVIALYISRPADTSLQNTDRGV